MRYLAIHVIVHDRIIVLLYNCFAHGLLSILIHVCFTKRCDCDDHDKGRSDGEAEPSWAPELRNLDAPCPSLLVRHLVIDCVFKYNS